MTLIEHGHDVIGVDQSPAMLKLAAAKAPQAQFRVGHLTGLPIPDASVDLVLCALALCHLDDVGEAIAEFRRVLRPGGRLIVTDVHPIMLLLTSQLIFACKHGSWHSFGGVHTRSATILRRSPHTASRLSPATNPSTLVRCRPVATKKGFLTRPARPGLEFRRRSSTRCRRRRDIDPGR